MAIGSDEDWMREISDVFIDITKLVKQEDIENALAGIMKATQSKE